MNRLYFSSLLALSLAFFSGCNKNQGTPDSANNSESVTTTEATTPAERVGNNYKVTFKVLRQNQSPAAGFKVELWVKGKSEPRAQKTNDAGIVEFTDLPFPDKTNQLKAALHYKAGKSNEPREITYPYIDSDAFRLKDTQYIPNTATPE